MELLRRTQTADTWWSLLLFLLGIFNLLTLHTTNAECFELNVEKMKPRNITHPRPLILSILDEKTQIYLADLERAIDHILRYQILKVTSFKEPKLIVLKNIIALLHYLNPLDTHEGKLYINKIYWSIQARTELTHEYIESLVNDTTLVDKSFKEQDYVGCRGSEPEMREFNCSLWILFHYLTVQAAIPPNCFHPGAVLWTLHGYVQHFMGCPECYQNFWIYAQQKQIDDVKTHDDEILWLWRAHNYFNKKLGGGIKEDPFFPKQQFPPRKYCRRCRNLRGQWKTNEVLKYLKTIYSLESLYSFGLKNGS